jgi:hypothetical protein
MKFSIQYDYQTRESIAVATSCRKLKLDFKISKRCIDGYIPIGNIEYCESILNITNKPINFYPSFLKDYINRKIDFYFIDSVLKEDLFLKESNKWKSNFESKVYEKGFIPPKNFYFCSEPIEFIQEWRYYVANGEVVCSVWYNGIDESENPPELKIKYPKNFSGCVDFGRDSKERIQLVEAHAPYACGWYGDLHEDYTIWQYLAWEDFINNQDFWRI